MQYYYLKFHFQDGNKSSYILRKFYDPSWAWATETINIKDFFFKIKTNFEK